MYSGVLPMLTAITWDRAPVLQEEIFSGRGMIWDQQFSKGARVNEHSQIK